MNFEGMVKNENYLGCNPGRACISLYHSKYFSHRHPVSVLDTLHIQRIVDGIALPDRIYSGVASA
jgi:hypothetical protein